MSVNDIMKYVSQTPGNTNPSVIKSMVEAEVENGQKDVVKYTPQSLTDEQKTQARENIGAACGLREITLTTPLSANEYIPLSDEENTMLAAAAAENRPVCITFTAMDGEEVVMQASVIANKMTASSTIMYMAITMIGENVTALSIASLNGKTWSATHLGSNDDNP